MNRKIIVSLFFVLLHAYISYAAPYSQRGAIEGVSGLNYSNLSMSEGGATVTITNNTATPIEFSGKVQAYDGVRNLVIRESSIISGTIPAMGSAKLTSSYTEVRSAFNPKLLYQTRWVHVEVEPIEEQKKPSLPIPSTYLTARQMQTIINKYINECPLSQIERELGQPLYRDNARIAWQVNKDSFTVIMDYDATSKTVRFAWGDETFSGALPRDKRYAQIVSDFKTILGTPYQVTPTGTSWETGDDGWHFLIAKSNRDGLMYHFVNVK